MGLKKWYTIFVLTGILLLPVVAHAEPYWFFENNTRYMALGDSLAAGYGAIPATQGYVYLLYQSGVFDTIPNTISATRRSQRHQPAGSGTPSPYGHRGLPAHCRHDHGWRQ
jgi:hypothetical protein